MKTFCIEWRGRITRDVGWDYIEADSIEQARENWLSQHGTDRVIHGIRLSGE